jgi:hypothetical protein
MDPRLRGDEGLELTKNPKKASLFGVLRVIGMTDLLAEKAGFEPAEGITPRTLSRRVT